MQVHVVGIIGINVRGYHGKGVMLPTLLETVDATCVTVHYLCSALQKEEVFILPHIEPKNLWSRALMRIQELQSKILYFMEDEDT
jgi:hypothetical protein